MEFININTHYLSGVISRLESICAGQKQLTQMNLTAYLKETTGEYAQAFEAFCLQINRLLNELSQLMANLVIYIKRVLTEFRTIDQILGDNLYA